MSPRRTIVVHEWLTTWAGSEQVVEQLLQVHVGADVAALIERLTPEERCRLGPGRLLTSSIQGLPWAHCWFRAWPPLLARAIEDLEVTGYDLVVSSSHCVAKGVRAGPDALHLCYCHSPMRYAWDLQERYLREAGLTSGWKGAFLGPVVRRMLGRMRAWDVRSAAGVDLFIANSRYVARRIARAWRRPALVVHPPVDVATFALQPVKQDYWLAASRLVPYKGMEVIVQAFAAMPDRRLVLVGDGPQAKRIAALARGHANIELRGHAPRAELVDLMQKARGFVFAAEEDFGIAPVEAMACGTPVIALGRGGALETVVEGVTGLFFNEATPTSICAAVARAAQMTWDPQACRQQAERFSQERFRNEWQQVVDLAERARLEHLTDGSPIWDDRRVERTVLAAWADRKK